MVELRKGARSRVDLGDIRIGEPLAEAPERWARKKSLRSEMTSGSHSGSVRSRAERATTDSMRVFTARDFVALESFQSLMHGSPTSSVSPTAKQQIWAFASHSGRFLGMVRLWICLNASCRFCGFWWGWRGPSRHSDRAGGARLEAQASVKCHCLWLCSVIESLIRESSRRSVLLIRHLPKIRIPSSESVHMRRQCLSVSELRAPPYSRPDGIALTNGQGCRKSSFSSSQLHLF
jgi:hypothetical protein